MAGLVCPNHPANQVSRVELLYDQAAAPDLTLSTQQKQQRDGRRLAQWPDSRFPPTTEQHLVDDLACPSHRERLGSGPVFLHLEGDTDAV